VTEPRVSVNGQKAPSQPKNFQYAKAIVAAKTIKYCIAA